MTDHMPSKKDELSKLGLDLSDLSCQPSENLQKWARVSLHRSSNGHSDALVQVASLFARKLQHSIQESLEGKSFLVDQKTRDRNKNKEIIRHANLFSGHKCISDDKRTWITKRFKKLCNEGLLTSTDVLGFDISSLLCCPFCSILGLEVKQKLPTSRSKTVLCADPELQSESESNESDSSYKTVDSRSSDESAFADDLTFEHGELNELMEK